MTYHTGKLLIATPELADPNFFRTVSLILHHNEEGAAGVILNRPSNTSIGHVWPELDTKDQRRPIHVGGPVEGPMMALHTNISLSESLISAGVYLSLERDCLEKLVEQEAGDLKLFSGYAGWGAGQLEEEMKVGGWLTFDCQPKDIFDTPEEIWKMACEKVGSQIMFSGTGLDINSVDPLAN